MRLPLVAALAAVASLSAPAAATNPGVGEVALAGTSFFRPNNGVAVAGSCQYAGTALSGAAVGVTVAPGNNTYTSIVCELRDSAGNVIAGTSGWGQFAAEALRVDLPGGATPWQVCGSAEAATSTWSHPARSGYSCAPVMPQI